MPRVLIDLRMVRNRLHGTSRYALELARRLPALVPECEFFGLTGPDGLPEDLGPLTPDLPLFSTPGDFLSLREQPGLMATLQRLSPDLFHATSFSLPALWNGPLVATLHDANHLALADQYGPGRAAYYQLVVRPRALRAQGLITVSSFSQGELAEHLRMPRDRFRVIYNGVDARFQPKDAHEIEEFKRRHRLPERYLLSVGNEKAFKNLGMLAQLAPKLPFPVVLAAGTGITHRYAFPPQTVEVPPLSEEEMPLLYGGATALLFPSYYEGFGLPAVEAMACGCPVLASRAGAHPEVLAQAGVLLSPEDGDGWLKAVHRLIDDPAHTARLVSRGLKRAKLFNWDACAEQTAEVYQQALFAASARSA